MKSTRTWGLALLLAVAGGGLASANLSWQTPPILGTDAQYTGDVVVITGPQPLDGAGNPYYAWPGGPEVLGPTIPHYNLPGDPLYGVGAPSMTVFSINPNQWIGGHWTDPDSEIATGSGVYLTPGRLYHWKQEFTYLGSLQPSYSIAYEDDYFADPEAGGFVMLVGDDALVDLWAEDLGHWNYTETWTERSNTAAPSSFLQYSTDFTVVPTPGALLLGFLGISAAGLKLRQYA